MSSIFIGSLICFLVMVVADAMEMFKNKYGQPCEDDIDCGGHGEKSYMSCEKGHCACPRGSHSPTLLFSANYTEQLDILCKEYESCFNYINECTYGTCIADHCQCTSDEIRVEVDKTGTKCLYSKRQVAQDCGELAGMCNAQQQLYCINASCRCKENYIYHREKSTCLELKDFLYSYNMLIYRGLFGFYCTEDAHCSSSFVCSQKNFSCICPQGCSYLKWEETCICRTQYASGPVVIGIVGSVAIFLFWSKKIFALCQKYRSRHHAEVDVDTLERREHNEGTSCILPPSATTPASPVDYSQPPPPYSANIFLIATHMEAPPSYEEAMRSYGINTAKVKENMIT